MHEITQTLTTNTQIKIALADPKIEKEPVLLESSSDEDASHMDDYQTVFELLDDLNFDEDNESMNALKSYKIEKFFKIEELNRSKFCISPAAVENELIMDVVDRNALIFST